MGQPTAIDSGQFTTEVCQNSPLSFGVIISYANQSTLTSALIPLFKTRFERFRQCHGPHRRRLSEFSVRILDIGQIAHADREVTRGSKASDP
jgi:hypothetical protein